MHVLEIQVGVPLDNLSAHQPRPRLDPLLPNLRRDEALSLPASDPTNTDIAIELQHDRTSCRSSNTLLHANFDVSAEVRERVAG